MNDFINIEVEYNNTEYTPGESISGKLLWNGESKKQGKKVSLHLLYCTEGKSSEKSEVIEVLEFPLEQKSAAFSFVLPDGPYSFKGKNLSLNWYLEAALPVGKVSTNYQFTLTHNGKEIILTEVKDAVSKKKINSRVRSSSE